MDTIKIDETKQKYIKDTKEFFEKNPSVDFDDFPERFKRADMLLRAVRYILETPEGEDIITQAEIIMKEPNRQVKMGWERGRAVGLLYGISGTIGAFIVIGMIIKLLY